MTDGADLQRQPAPLAEALLPAGFADLLPAAAEHEAQLTAQLLNAMRLRGYRRVTPPLVEFERSLTGGAGESKAAAAFRLMDPVSQSMMALRPDMTPQVARIAATRLRNAPRPLRLSYAGQVLRVDRDQLRPERQFAQVGAEVIGGDRLEGDVEILVMCVEALGGAGVRGVSVDLSAPTLVDAALAPFDFGPAL
ncbi:MAG: ATP phosphoribosyltransferase regulatory subunit, partial [Pseudomonadota bacterium]